MGKKMSNPKKFMTDIQTLDLDQISEEAISKCRIYTALPWFSFEVVKLKNVAAAHLVHWVIHVVEYRDCTDKSWIGLGRNLARTRFAEVLREVLGRQALGQETPSKIEEQSA